MSADTWDPSIAATLVAEAPDLILTLDHLGRIRQANPATLRESGFTVDELRSRPIADFLPGLDPMRVLAARERSADGRTEPVTIRYHRKDGALRWLSVRVARLPERDRDAAWLVFARDVSDDIVRTSALRDSNERFRALVSAFDRAFFVLDPDLRMAGIFGRWTRDAGVIPSNWLGRTPEELFPQTGGEPHRTFLRKALAGEDVTYEFDYTDPNPNGTLALRVQASPMRGPDGQVVGIAGVATDITRRRRAAAEADALRARVADAERAESLAKLVSGVAHELNNPLAAILTFAEDLALTEADPERRAALDVVRAQALRSRVIVRDLLTFARKGAHRPRAPQRPGPLLENAVRALRPTFQRGVRLTLDVRDEDVAIEVDRTGIEQVVTNLVSNAAQAARDDGWVRVTGARDGAHYVLTVSDDGPGIPDEVRSRIFEPFFTTKPDGVGTGLGLPVSLGIVQEHGGTIEAANGAVGAVFTVRLPLSAKAAVTPTPPLGSASVHPLPPAPGGPPRLLVVDDEEPIRRALKRYFERNGWVVDEAPSGAVALRFLDAPGAAERYAAILCDLRMPGVDGPAVYEWVRAHAPALLPRMVMCTGDVSSAGAAAFLARLETPVLEKPFELTDVLALFERLRTGAP